MISTKDATINKIVTKIEPMAEPGTGFRRLALLVGSMVWEAAEQELDSIRVDMILLCPSCGIQHVDKPEPPCCDEPSYDAHGNGAIGHEHRAAWSNPPHKSHFCHGCKTIWRPADVPTNGVATIKTKGDADTWIPPYQEGKDEK